MFDDPYAVLGVSRNATKQEIKKAYRQCVKKYHPDLNQDDPDANEKMNKINVAYDMLTQPEKFVAYRAEQQYRRQRHQSEQQKAYQKEPKKENDYRKAKIILVIVAIVSLVGVRLSEEFSSVMFFAIVYYITIITVVVAWIVDWHRKRRSK